MNFVSKLDCLFDIGAPDAVDEIMKSRLLTKEKKEDDVQFYLDQRKDRKATMNGHDKVFEARIEKKLARLNRELVVKGDNNSSVNVEPESYDIEAADGIADDDDCNEVADSSCEAAAEIDQD